MKKMNRVIAVVAAATAMTAMAALTGCGVHTSFTTSNSSKMTDTYNGISRTVTTSTVNGRTETETVYTDEDGNVLDAETGKAAFAAGKAGEADPLKYVQDEEADGDKETAEDVQDEVFKANLTIINNTGADIKALYGSLAEDENWSDNWLEDGLVLEDGEECKTTATYGADTAFNLGFVTVDGEEADFENFTFEHVTDPENITITFTDLGDAFNMNVR